MDNIKILKNFPATVTETFARIYDKKFKNTHPQHKWTPEHSGSVLKHDDVDYLNQFLPLPAHAIEVYYVTGTSLPHIDRGRKTALHIPMAVDLKNSFIFSLVGKDLSKLSSTNCNFTPRDVDTVNDPPNWFYDWNDTLFDKYNLEHPVIHNVALPHGAIHVAARPAIFFSVTYKNLDYDEVCTGFSSWV